MEVHNKPVPASAVQNLHLDGLYQDVKEVLHASEALIASLAPAQMTWKPKKNQWSILECFHHMLVVNNLYLPRIIEAMKKGATSHAEAIAPFKPSLFGRWFLGFVRPESKLKLKTFKVFKPQKALDDMSVLAKFTEQQRVLMKVLKKADGCDLNNVKLASPASRLIRFSIGEALTLLVLHEQRHLLQAQNILLLSDFPEFQA